MKVTIKGKPLKKTSEQLRNAIMIGHTSLADKIADEIASRIDMDLTSPINGCIHCGGTGRLKEMQSIAVVGGGSVRGPDTMTKCNFCNGTGRG